MEIDIEKYHVRRWLAGLTPAQHSSGGKARLGAISCRDDGCLRTLLQSLHAGMPFGKVLVAIANKHARQAWAMLAHETDYDPNAWLTHPMVQRPVRKRKTN